MSRLEASFNKQVAEARRKAMRRRKSPESMTREELIEEVKDLRWRLSWVGRKDMGR